MIFPCICHWLAATFVLLPSLRILYYLALPSSPPTSRRVVLVTMFSVFCFPHVIVQLRLCRGFSFVALSICMCTRSTIIRTASTFASAWTESTHIRSSSQCDRLYIGFGRLKESSTHLRVH
ncbi:hypothetical protein L226DRAFT_330218 [Lentinus tigrinus ALCF2SS1-7]|uniref:Uncharacterized protein n=1 Tax=Lentinus tigrinus ALCF2SS1-6 TaxID=1328759 RepID=A0A5C2SFV2_9APHY|nr:hypothetical protein L227DRAFT_38212 [Lentinus tigrinus ALCF2SS1-6]RPD77714.1 hypothetical protein L226DRAFT_330218 [Lentinus tigrinus ALCF2SS1-7]